MSKGARQQDITVTILPDGQVEFHLEGFGKGCDDYIKLLQELLNAKVESKKYTSEYYTISTTVSTTTKISS